MKKYLILIYSLVCYMAGLCMTAYYFLFFAELIVPKSINSGSPVSITLSLVIDVMLLSLFMLQHSGMARKGFKKLTSRWIPEAAQRSTYVLMTSLTLAFLVWFWEPLPYVIFNLKSSVAGNVIWALYGLGWVVCLSSTFLVDHLDLFGLRQAWYYLKGKKEFNYRFKTPLLYKVIRHPIYLGWLMVHWITPNLTAGHLLFAVSITIYVYVAIEFEERDLIRDFGSKYIHYQKSTYKVIPFFSLKQKAKHEKVSV